MSSGRLHPERRDERAAKQKAKECARLRYRLRPLTSTAAIIPRSSVSKHICFMEPWVEIFVCRAIKKSGYHVGTFRCSSPSWFCYRSANERGAITRKSAHADLTSLLALDHFENGGKTRAYLVIPDQRRILRGMA